MLCLWCFELITCCIDEEEIDNWVWDLNLDDVQSTYERGLQEEIDSVYLSTQFE